ncbi:c-type cytochrome [Puia dinghuensis]|uniref:Cytochrome c n=1 Tax=Puia dinghuensis TaxID=1792502 RepID=A0A8J2UFE3_9BACT|nr:cytochrome c [Puia dinghuensis]GGB10195.1 cytochrome c [Puia dinghuensis]
MKKVIILSSIVVGITTFISCGGVQRDPGRVYMPDMGYSRAYETYATTEEQKAELLKQGIHFSNTPVPGTIKRGELFPFLLTKDAAGDTTNYHASREVKNPLTSMDTVEAERLYLVNCAICHGPKLDGNGPLYKGGDGPFPSKPATLVGDARYEAMPEGQMYYSVTYGKNKMGSYASQLSTMRRWMVIVYIKSKQAAAHPAGASAGSSSSASADSTAKK